MRAGHGALGVGPPPTAASIAAVAAATLPSLLAYNVSPSPTFLNQALALALWAVFVIVGAPAAPGRGPWPLWAALGLVAAAVAWSWGPGALPATLALSALGLLAAAAVVVAGAAGVRARPDAATVFAAFCWAWLAAGLLNVGIAVVQVFLPGVPDGEWIARSGLVGRAVGNLRQPNHLSSLLLWACIATVALAEMGRLGRRAAAAALAALVFAVVLTASRTGLVSVALLALWGLADRRLSRPARGLLLAAPVLYALCWFGLSQWAAASQHTFGGAQRLAESDISSSRFGIWANTLALIRQHPWAGVGFGEFNLAWTLTPFPGRPTAFFDHTHNLPLQLAVELGLPLAAAVMALLGWALWRAARAAWAAGGDDGTAQRAALLMVLMIGLHSLLEYPLWYSYFLLPAAWAWGYALGTAEPAEAAHALPADLTASASPPASAASAQAAAVPTSDAPAASITGTAAAPSPAVALGALAVLLGAAASVIDYTRVAAIFSAQPGALSLAQRVAAGQRSWFFGHHADYAAVTAGLADPADARAFDRAPHYLLDTRLMIAWAKALAAQGRDDEARHLAARLREFRKAEAAEFFAPCETGTARAAKPETPASVEALPAATDSASTAPTLLPFQCQAPTRAVAWAEYLRG